MSHMQDVILESIKILIDSASESLILASLSTISMSHMQDVILEIYLNLESNFHC